MEGYFFGIFFGGHFFFWLLAYWLLAFGFWLPVFGFWLLAPSVSGFWLVFHFGAKISDLRAICCGLMSPPRPAVSFGVPLKFR